VGRWVRVPTCILLSPPLTLLTSHAGSDAAQKMHAIVVVAFSGNDAQCSPPWPDYSRQTIPNIGLTVTGEDAGRALALVEIES